MYISDSTISANFFLKSNNKSFSIKMSDDEDRDPMLASVSAPELPETGCALWMTRWTKFLLYSSPIVSAVYCIYYIVAQEASVAVRYSRYLSAVAAVLMITSIFMMNSNITFWRNSLLCESLSQISKTHRMFARRRSY
jgi:hypothetical protein